MEMPTKFSDMRRPRSDQEGEKEHRADIRSITERYHDLKRDAGRKDVMEEGRLEEEEN